MKKTLILAISLAASPALIAQTFTSTGGPSAIPDDDLFSPACLTVAVPAGTVSGLVTAEISATHTWIGDLDITLDSPAGSPLFLRDRATIVPTGFGDSSDLDSGTPISFFDGGAEEAADMGVACDATGVLGADCGGEFNPSNAISAFDGESAVGDWTLCIGDGGAGDTGDFTSWSLVGDGTLPVELQNFSID